MDSLLRRGNWKLFIAFHSFRLRPGLSSKAIRGVLITTTSVGVVILRRGHTAWCCNCNRRTTFCGDGLNGETEVSSQPTMKPRTSPATGMNLDIYSCAVRLVEDPTHAIIINLEANDFRQALVGSDRLSTKPTSAKLSCSRYSGALVGLFPRSELYYELIGGIEYQWRSIRWLSAYLHC